MSKLVNQQISIQEQINKSVVKGYDIYKAQLVNPIESENPEVKAYMVGLNQYIVSEVDRDNGIYHCDCKDFEYREYKEACKHIFAVQFHLGA